MQQIFTTCSPRACQHGNPGTEHWAGGKHWTMYCTHHNMTTWNSILIGQHVFFNSKCSTLSRQQLCSTWPHYVLLSFSMALDEPSRKTFSSPKNARGWQLHCKEASSGRQPAEQLWEEGEQQCHVHVSIHRDLLGHNLHCKWRLNQSHFCLQRGLSAGLQQRMGKLSNHLFPLQQTCCSRTPVTLCWVLLVIAPAPHFSKSSWQGSKAAHS